MNEYIKQHIFNENNIKLFYLSPYAEVKRIADDIVFIRQERDTAMLLPYREGRSDKLVELLINGIEEKVLLQILSELTEESEDWLYGCIWDGIIE